MCGGFDRILSKEIQKNKLSDIHEMTRKVFEVLDTLGHNLIYNLSCLLGHNFTE